MISAILLDRDNNPVRVLRQVANMFIAERVFDYATGSLSLSVNSRRENSILQPTKSVYIFGDGINRLFVVDKITFDNTANFPKITFDLSGIEHILARRNEADKEIKWQGLNAMEICVDLVYLVQTSSAARYFSQLETESTIIGTVETQETAILSGGNVWDAIKEMMTSYEFCCDAITSSFGKSRLQFRYPDDRTDIIISDLSKQSHLQYVNTDYANTATHVTIGGEYTDAAVKRRYAIADTEETGIDRFEIFEEASDVSSNGGYLSANDYTEALNSAAKQKIKPVFLETDYIVPSSLFLKVKTGDTIYTSSAAVNSGKLEPRRISELKTELVNGALNRSLTFINEGETQ